MPMPMPMPRPRSACNARQGWAAKLFIECFQFEWFRFRTKTKTYTNLHLNATGKGGREGEVPWELKLHAWHAARRACWGMQGARVRFKVAPPPEFTFRPIFAHKSWQQSWQHRALMRLFIATLPRQININDNAIISTWVALPPLLSSPLPLSNKLKKKEFFLVNYGKTWGQEHYE